MSKNNNINNNNNKCIGPCYPPNVIFYNPINLQSFKNPSDSMCPIKKTKINDNIKYIDKCYPVDDNYENYDIFNDNVSICKNDDEFLKQIYNINNLGDSVKFLDDDFDILPLYSRIRIINAIVNVYLNFIEFPHKLSSIKVKNILDELYDTKIDENKIYDNIMRHVEKKKKFNNIIEYFGNKLEKI